MSTVTVFRFRKYDVSTDGYVRSRRWATQDAIAHIGGEMTEDAGVEVDQSVVGAEIEGMTARDFDPHPSAGLQRQVLTGLRSR